MRALALIAVMVLGTVRALAQPPPNWNPPPNWSPGQGWDVRTMDDFDEIQRQHHEDFERRVAESRRRFEETKASNDRDFNRFGGMVLAFMGFIVVVGIVSAISGTRRRRRAYEGPPLADDIPVVSMAAFSSAGSVDVTALRIGIDGRASRFVRTELEAIAKTHAANDPDTRARKLREVSIMLRRVRDSWVYGGADNEPLRERDEAIRVFLQRVDDARSRVRRGAQHVTPPTGIPVSMILVSVIVAARGELMSVTDLATGEDLRRALESAAHRAPSEILALDVVWVPDSEGEQVSSIDLESVYRRSELHPLEGATVGKVFCTYCNGPFPAELVSCPHCGGPAPGRERRA
jgi:uncharacterized membrane protein